MGIPIPTRLWWTSHEGKGLVRHRGVQVEVEAPPSVPGLPEHLTEIDYFERRGELRVSADRRREMTVAECDAVLRYLERIATAARAALGIGE
jgi:hypothetical protein